MLVPPRGSNMALFCSILTSSSCSLLQYLVLKRFIIFNYAKVVSKPISKLDMAWTGLYVHNQTE